MSQHILQEREKSKKEKADRQANTLLVARELFAFEEK